MTLLVWALQGWATKMRRRRIVVCENLLWRRVEARYEIGKRADRALLWLAARLPHRLTAWVLAHVGAATIRPDENVADARWMDLVGRWDRRELQGRAAERHRPPT